jgi:hypothetical protein
VDYHRGRKKHGTAEETAANPSGRTAPR